ncbi:MAG: tellurite resistance TerB family protein [Trichodesmium sp. St16_bin4-tuft]|nr:tellurite resistance TerB family protein [Trichodesmium sp. MAG_R01]MDE5100048.1 tellurite resistance TerB family protein [Trichodesmium sp. St16_bin4-tuft]MDE5105333.1 tellurite resistance TerB family protein [Trichodesmium sp. St19_bin2]
MSYEYIFNSKVKSSEELTPNEAIFAIGLMVMAVDGDIDMNEVEIIEGFLVRKGFTAQEVNLAREKVLRIIAQEKNEALFYAAKQVLQNEKEIETAFDLAVEVAMADNKLTEEEDSFVFGLAKSLKISREKVEQKFANATKYCYNSGRLIEKIEEILLKLPIGSKYEGYINATTDLKSLNLKIRTPNDELVILNIDETGNHDQIEMELELAPPWML